MGLLRILGEQRPQWGIRGAWRGDRFVLASRSFENDDTAPGERVSRFLLTDYQPTPIIAPWNGGSGFYAGDNAAALNAIAASEIGRLPLYRAAINFARGAVQKSALEESPKEDSKAVFLKGFRASAPEALLDWLDAAVMLTGNDTRFPPLLGTGGNDGRLDFTNNFMQRLCELFNPATGKPHPFADLWLRASLFGEAAPKMPAVSIGQFNPGAAGGPNASQGFDGKSLVNPWDFVLMLEGAVLFAAAATRRLESAAPGTLAYPFTVRTTSAGNGGLAFRDQGQARAEMWLPLWDRFASLAELRRLLSEGRATLNAQAARDGLGFARAVAGLGIDRGIASFQRFGFLMRAGKSYLATPLARVQVRGNPHADLIDDLDSGAFLDRVRRFARDDQAPQSIRSNTRRLEDAVFDLTRGGGALAIQDALRVLGALIYNLSKTAKGREAVPRLPRLRAAWVSGSDDGSAEFRCAAALAGLNASGLPLVPFILPVADCKQGNWEWSADSRVAVWNGGSAITENLSRIAARRLVEDPRPYGNRIPFAGARLADILAFLTRKTDDLRLGELLLGLLLATIPSRLGESRHETALLPGAYCTLKPFFVPKVQLDQCQFIEEDQTLPFPAEIIASLRGGHTQRGVDLAWRRLHAADAPLPSAPRAAPAVCGLNGLRLLAALTIPINTHGLHRCLDRLRTPEPTNQELATGEEA